MTATFLEEYEGLIRLSIFFGVFALMALLETLLPRKRLVLPRAQRWLTNWGLVVIDTVALRLIIPVFVTGMAVGAAHLASENGWGLLNNFSLANWVEALIAFLLLDLFIYIQHVATHHIPVLWRLHKVHHADRDIDVTTGARFHPVEILLSMGYKIICVICIGAPAVAVFVFEVVLNAGAMFNHANVKLPQALDKMLRLFIVTPDMHRVHHSVIPKETNSNYGFFLSVWDRIFSTYIPQPRQGHEGMNIGLKEFQNLEPTRLVWSLRIPFVKKNVSVTTSVE